MNKIRSVRNKRILLLQGPMGTFFKKLDRQLRLGGAKTYKVGLNMGDRFFSWRDNYTPYRGTPEDWPAFVSDFLDRHRIDMVFLFGDCRYYQRIVRQKALQRDIDLFVFEEGYIRPDYITMERFGVNGYSKIPAEASFYEDIVYQGEDTPLPARPSKTKMIISATLYYALSNLFHFRYPHYIHHRDFSALKEAFYGIRGLVRKGVYAVTERGYLSLLTRKLSKRYYFVPLQTHNDFQILEHSPYRSIEKFIIEVLESFATYAPDGTFIVFKHHPVDRGRKNYDGFIRAQAELFGIRNRVIVIHDVHLPSCLKHAVATITINSTVGLSAIGHEIPTLTMGSAIYDIEGLTNKGVPIDRFWCEYRVPDRQLYLNFRQYLIENTQLNGSFYGLFPYELRAGKGDDLSQR
jgi:capsular polysaccharide export protein